MALRLLPTKNSPSAADLTTFSALSGPNIDRSDVVMITQLLSPIVPRASLDPEGETLSLSFPRTPFRERLLKQPAFQRAVASLPVTIRDYNARAGELGEPMSAPVYVSDTRYNKLQHSAGRSLIHSEVKFRWLEDQFAEWGYVRIPIAVLLLCAGTFLWSGWKLGKYAIAVISEYAAATEAAASSDAGLKAAVEKRGGIAKEAQY